MTLKTSMLLWLNDTFVWDRAKVAITEIWSCI